MAKSSTKAKAAEKIKVAEKAKVYHVVVPFLKTDDQITMGVALEKSSADAARRTVLNLAEQGNGGVAFSRTIDPTTGDASDPELILEAGNLPADWRDLLSE